MSRGLQARIIAALFALSALVVVAAIADDWRRERALPTGGTPSLPDRPTHAER